MISCSKVDKNFEFQISNETDFHIESLDFRFHDFEQNFELEPHSSTSLFSAECDSRELVGPCTANISVRRFTDGITNYENDCGLEIPRPNFEDLSTVIFVLEEKNELLDNCPQDFFTVTIKR